MTDAQGGEAAAVDTTAQAAVEAAVSSQERDFDKEARDMGWVPEAEWKGDKRPKNFLSAEEFVERGETMIPLLNKRLKEKDEEFAKRIARLESSHERTVERLKKAHDRELADLTGQRREAIRTGDVAAVEAFDREIADLKEAGPGTPAKKTDADVQAAWLKDNPWFEADEDLQVAAVGYSNTIKSDDLSLEDNLKKVDAYMRKKFPDKFGGTKEQTAANGHAAVDGGGQLSGIVPHKATVFDKLPSEAKRQFEKDVASGAFKNTAADREQWAKHYNS